MGLLYMIIAVLHFTAMSVCLKFLPHIPAVELVFFRGLLSLIFTLALLKHNNIYPWGNNKKLLIFRGLFGTIALVMLFYTLQVLPLGMAVTIQYLSPIFTVIISYFWLKEKPLPVQWLFFVVAFFGVSLIQNQTYEVNLWPIFIGIVGALFASCAYAIVRKLRQSEDVLVIVLYFPLVTVPLLLPITIYKWVTPAGYDWFFVFAIGVLTQIAQIYLTKAFKAASASEVSVGQYVGVVLAVIIGYFGFDEQLSVMSLMGIGLIMLSVGMNALVARKQAT